MWHSHVLVVVDGQPLDVLGAHGIQDKWRAIEARAEKELLRPMKFISYNMMGKLVGGEGLGQQCS